MGTWGGYLQVHLNQLYFWWLCCNGSNAKTGIRCHLTFSLCIDLPKWMRKHMRIYLKFGSIEFKFKNDQPKRQNQIYESWCHPSMLSSEVNTHIGWEIDSKCIEGIRHLGCLSSDTLKWSVLFGFCFNVGKLKNNLLEEIKEGTEIILKQKNDLFNVLETFNNAWLLEVSTLCFERSLFSCYWLCSVAIYTEYYSELLFM